MKYKKQIQRIEKALDNKTDLNEVVILINRDGKYYYNEKELSQKEYEQLKEIKDIVTLSKANESE
jgi:biopolymer transport protein ExbD